MAKKPKLDAVTAAGRQEIADAVQEVAHHMAHSSAAAFTAGLRDMVFTHATSAMVGVLQGKSPHEATQEEMADVLSSYRKTIDPHLRNEAARAGVRAALTLLSEDIGIFPRELTQEVVGAFQALDEGEVKRIAVESPVKRRGSGTEYDRTALWIAVEVHIMRALSSDARSVEAAVQVLTGVRRNKTSDKPLSSDWRLAPMPETNFPFVDKLRRRGDDLLNQRGGWGLKDVATFIEQTKKNEPLDPGFADFRETMQKTFTNKAARQAWLRKIGAIGGRAVGRKRRTGTQPDAPL